MGSDIEFNLAICSHDLMTYRPTDGLKLPLKERKKISRNRTRLDLSDVKLPLSPYLAKLTCSRRMTHADPSESKWKRGKVEAKYCETQFDLWVAHLVRLVSFF